MNLLSAMTKQKDWFVVLDDTVIGGPFRTRREARLTVWADARDKGDGHPFGTMSPRDPDAPSFYTVMTDSFVYHVGLGSALYDQGYEKELGEYLRGAR